MSSILAVSISCFMETEKDLIKKIEYINSLDVDGIELFGQELIQYESLGNLIDILSQFKYKSIHMPIGDIGYSYSKEGREVFDKLYDYAKLLNIQTLIFHPIQIIDYNIFNKNDDLINFGIENMPDGKRKVGYQTIEDMKNILSKNKNIKFVLDTSHSFSNNIDPIKFLELENRICQVHLSGVTKIGINADHILLSKSSSIIIQKLKPILDLKKPLVLEIESLKGNINLMQEEIKFVKKLM